MFGRWKKRREQQIERWKIKAREEGANFLLIVYDSWDGSLNPCFDRLSQTWNQMCLTYAPIHSSKYIVDFYDLRKSNEDIK